MAKVWAIVDTYNVTTYDTNTISVILPDQQRLTLRIDESIPIQNDKIYQFDIEPIVFKERDQHLVHHHLDVDDPSLDVQTRYKAYGLFYKTSPVDCESMIHKIESAIDAIKNPAIKQITQTLYNAHKSDFYLYPAATKFHHAYIGGIAHHTTTMLALMDGFLNVYTYLNKDLLSAGIILHDLFKIEELSNPFAPEYTKEGKLIGHITMGAQAIRDTAIQLNLYESEARLLLEHMVLSHHYYGNFGSPKKPNIPEALALHYIDNIDSKFAVLGETLETTEPGQFTAGIPILERERYYRSITANIPKK